MAIQVKALKGQAKQLRERVYRSPFMNSRPLLLVRGVFRELSDDDATHMAAGMAYYGLFSLFPLLLGLLAIAGTFLDSEEVQARLLRFVTQNLPGSGDLVRQNIQNVVRFRGALGIVSIIGLLWSASAVFGAIARVLNRAWGIQQDRPFYISKPRQIAMALGVGVLFVLSVAVTSAIRYLATATVTVSGVELSLPTWATSFVLQLVPLGISFSIFLLVYKFVPNRVTPWRFVWPGAALAAVLFEAGKNLFVWYLGTFASYDQIYGSLASVIVLLLWIYISSFILILGAEVNSEYEKLAVSEQKGLARTSAQE